MLVEAPFQNREERGIVVSVHDRHPGIDLKEISHSAYPDAVVNRAQIDLAGWMSEQYLCAPGEALFKMFPSAVTPSRVTQRGSHLRVSHPAVSRSAKIASRKIAVEQRVECLTEEQKGILSILKEEIGRRSSFHLIHGVTGSGKTEIYIRALQAALDLGRGGILLVPEISLTVQTLARLEAVFGDELALLHSGRKPRERFGEYQDVLSGRRRIVVGTRSAVFAPVVRPGVIILDEEHDSSYREHSTPRYDARHIARRRGEEGAVVVFGSATPRIEIRYAAERFDVRREIGASENGGGTGKAKAETPAASRYFYHRMTKRASGDLPTVEIIPREDYDAPISRSLLLDIEENFRSGLQTVLLLNRRGYQPFLVCKSCRKTLQCPRCAVSLTLHRDNRLLCHQCGFTQLQVGLCPLCGGTLRRLGTGVQKVEEHLLSLYPEMRIERLDTDSAAKGDGVEGVLARFLSGDIDLLTGTQMIAKGLDSPRVTLVGVLQADLGLSLPDFRSMERVFSLLMQVAGRAGRGESKGRVVFEAMNPDHPVLLLARDQDYEGFYRSEIAERREHGYPPFRRLVRLLVRAKEEDYARDFSEALAGLLDVEFRDSQNRIEVLGPAPAPLSRLQNRYRYHLILKTNDPARVRDGLRRILPDFRSRLGEKAYLEIEFDPMDLL